MENTPFFLFFVKQPSVAVLNCELCAETKHWAHTLLLCYNTGQITKQGRMYSESLTLDLWIWWVSSIIYCTNAHFRIIYIVPSVHFFYYNHVVDLKKCQPKTNCWPRTHTKIASQSGMLWDRWQRDQGRSQRPAAFFLTRSSPELHLKVQTAPTSHILSLSSLWSPAVGCWVHTIQLCRLREATGRSAKGPLQTWGPCDLHMTHLQSTVSYWVHWCPVGIFHSNNWNLFNKKNLSIANWSSSWQNF